MIGLHTVAAVRGAERQLLARLPDGTLMRRAAAALAARCAALLPRVYGARIVLLVGSGDNGGDALYAGARLAARGARVEAVLASSRAHPGGLAALRTAGGRVVDVVDVVDAVSGGRAIAGAAPTPGGAPDRLFAAADLVLDGLVGIGATGPLREPAATLVRSLATAGIGAPVLAVDVPSGVDADTGAVSGPAVRADRTVTFGAVKPGLVLSPGAAFAGAVGLVDIGLGPHLPTPGATVLSALDVAERLPLPEPESSKYRRGVLGVAAGSQTYPGAAVLTVGGALRGGAGMVRFTSAAAAAEAVLASWPETVVTAVAPGAAAVESVGRVQAWVVGPGVGTDADSARVVEAVLATDVPVLVDADALTVCAAHPDWLRRRGGRRDAATLLTPHVGEFARLGGEAAADTETNRLEAARRMAGDLRATVLLKGSTTVVASPTGQARVNATGTPWLATAGSGDVLAGVAGALLAAGLAPLEAGSVAAHLHGLAARIGAGQSVDTGIGARGETAPARALAGAPITATDLLASWRDAVRVVRCGRTRPARS